MIELRLRSIATKLFLVAALLAWCNSSSDLPAQTITIRFLNAKNGKPVKTVMVTFEWKSGRLDRSEIMSDKQGLGSVEVPAGEREFSIEAGPKIGKEPYRIPYLDCNEGRPTFIQVALVVEKGYVLPNTCGQKSAVAHPGEIVFWLLRNPWWKPDMQ
jgi:hypothetical protein